MKLRSAAMVAGLALGLMSGAAKAATFHFAYNIPVYDPYTQSVVASGTLTATQIANTDTYFVQSIAGTRNGETITGLLFPGTFNGNDNIISLSEPYVDQQGLGYTVAGAGDNGSGYVDVTSNPRGRYTEDSSQIGFATAFTLSAVPLPPSAPMFGTALLALGAAGYGLKRKIAAAASA